MKSIIGISLALALGVSGAALAQGAAPQAKPNAPQNSAIKSPQDKKPNTPAAGANSFTRGQAKGHIEKAGYTNVSELKKNKDGLWQGRAMKDGKKVSVSLDFQGNVASK